MKRIFIAGLYSKNSDGSTSSVIEAMGHIRRGIYSATVLLSYGYAPYCPWLDYQYFILNKHTSLKNIHEMDLSFLRVCDAVYLKDPLDEIPENSQVHNELALAHTLNIPVFEDMEELLRYFEGKEYV